MRQFSAMPAVLPLSVLLPGAVLSSMLLFDIVSNAHAEANAVVNRLVLVDADSNHDILDLHDGARIALSELPSRALNVRAETSGDVQKVVFQLNNFERFREESAEPFSLAGDTAGNYRSWKPRMGENLIIATPYSGGRAGTPMKASFLVSETKVLDAPTASSEALGERSIAEVVSDTELARARLAEPEESELKHVPPEVSALTDTAESVTDVEENTDEASVAEVPRVSDLVDEQLTESTEPNTSISSVPEEVQVTIPPIVKKHLPLILPDGQSMRVVFDIDATRTADPHAAVATGKCTGILAQDRSAFQIVCNHTLREPLRAGLMATPDGSSTEEICPLGSPLSPIVQTCTLTEEQLMALRAGKFFVAVVSGVGGLTGWVTQ